MAAYKGDVLPKTPEPLAAYEWVESARLLDGAQIWEQSINLPSHKSVLSLLWVKHEIMKEQDDRDSLLEELDPEDFTLRRKRWPGKR
jgi:hypothetical protein